MSLETFPIFEVVAILGVIVGPLIAYFAAKRKIGAEVLLIDIETIKGWTEVRKSWAEELSELHTALVNEQNKRREERTKYLVRILELEEQIRELKKKLKECTEPEDD